KRPPGDPGRSRQAVIAFTLATLRCIRKPRQSADCGAFLSVSHDPRRCLAVTLGKTPKMKILPTEFDGKSIRRVYDEDNEINLSADSALRGVNW
ncbi:hypothetical protein, partial [Polaromonas sp.]|uniref:hypothetical protein n=1 Tax=Polaromonas sp. TaxID=1869339 RepID=UPI0025EEBB2B